MVKDEILCYSSGRTSTSKFRIPVMSKSQDLLGPHCDFNNTRKKIRPRETLRLAKEKLAKGLYSEALPMLEKIQDCLLEATFLLGVIYFDGLGVEIDMNRAIQHMKKVSAMHRLLPEEESFVRQAQYNLGVLYYKGLGLRKSNEDAEKYWLMASAGKKNPLTGLPHPATVKAQSALGKFYSHPDTHDIEKSFLWHSKACHSGSVDSEAALGVMYLYGLGCEEEPIKSYGFLINASLRGSLYARGYLTALYYMRELYHKVIETATWLSEIENFEQLAGHCNCDVEQIHQSVALGCFYLALCYQYGQAVAKDTEKARSLVQKALVLAPVLVGDLHVKSILGVL